VGEQPYRQLLKFPNDISPSEEFTRSYIEKYPEGFLVQVFYDPQNPENVTLEPGPAEGDWLVLAIGLGMFVLGIGMLFLAF